MKSILHFAASLAVCLWLAVALPCRAADTPERVYAVMSLAGNALSTVSFGAQIGSRLDPNLSKSVDVKSTLFDEAIVQAANAAVHRLAPQAKTVLMLTQDAELYRAQNDMFMAVEANKDNRDFLKSLLKNRAATHLILITKLRAEAELRLVNTTEGSGRIEGLGFYMNAGLGVRNDETLERTQGIVAPFAYLKVRLVDAATLEVLNESYQKRSLIAANFKSPESGMNTWDALSSEQKIAYLQELVKVAMDDAIPRLLISKD